MAIRFDKLGDHIEGGSDFHVYDETNAYRGFLCVTIDVEDKARARFVVGAGLTDERLDQETLDVEKAKEWVRGLLEPPKHICTPFCFEGLASVHAAKYGFMPNLSDLVR